MKIYNTLTRKKDEFIPIEQKKVRMYVCGPTVYNYMHIGNARPNIVFDTVRRYLLYKGYEVNYVLNFTDIDDKIIKRAIEEGVSSSDISERFIKEAEKDMKDLNILPATKHPKATEEIEQMIEMMEVLIKKGYAYEKNGTVYYRTRKFKDYGKLSKKNLDELEAGIRIAVSDEKEDSMDFVLWKPKKEGEPAWDSPWSQGRPGWHIECSAMSKRYLGDELDIHAGGEDCIFPHHENEIAQSEAANGKTFSRYWMHNAHLNIDNKKMSKSSGNFFTIREIGELFPLQILRFFMLSAHYRSPINFSKDLMESSKSALDRILTSVYNLDKLIKSSKKNLITEDEEKIILELEKYVSKFEAAMEDDFNTADAISVIFEMIKLINVTVTKEVSKELLTLMYNKVTGLCDILGIVTDIEEKLLDDDIEQLINDRQIARKNKDFAKADEIRDLLLEKKIILEDTREGVRWKRM